MSARCCGPNCAETVKSGATWCSAECERMTGIRYELLAGLRAAGYVDPDDGTVPRWPHDSETPVWVPAHCLADAILAFLPPGADLTGASS